METLSRFSPLAFSQGRILKNRVVVPPMASGTAASSGSVTGKTLDHYRNLAQSGAGLVIAEYSFVHPSGRSEENQLGAACDEQIAGLSRLAQTLHSTGALAGLQLTHSGGKSDAVLTGENFMGPSGIAVPVKGAALAAPRAMAPADIELWKRAFVAAAERAASAGFDLVEFHAAHGYGLNQFLSPLTNQRQDRYGGSPTGRSRLLQEIVTEVKARFPGLLLSVRMPGQDFFPGGFSPEDAVELALGLEASGVDILHVSSGIGGWRRPAPRRGEGYLVPEAALVQKAVGVPVIGVGGMETGAYIDGALQRGDFSLAAVGRAILRDPSAWRAKVLSCAAPCRVA
jgi:NADPH2 dehydrogenase